MKCIVRLKIMRIKLMKIRKKTQIVMTLLQDTQVGKRLLNTDNLTLNMEIELLSCN